MKLSSALLGDLIINTRSEALAAVVMRRRR
jgi:hypothetical protein